jgi:hypothetical protein
MAFDAVAAFTMGQASLSLDLATARSGNYDPKEDAVCTSFDEGQRTLFTTYEFCASHYPNGK